MRTDTTIYRARVRQSPRRIALRRTVFVTVFAVLLLVLVGLAFAGSASKLPAGTTVAGVDVGGMTQSQATQVLSQRAAAVEHVPVRFTVAGRSFALTASQVGIEPDWRQAVAAASSEGDGFGPVRGFKRLRARFSGSTSSRG